MRDEVNVLPFCYAGCIFSRIKPNIASAAKPVYTVLYSMHPNDIYRVNE
jgi:hypothetical protein